MDHIAETYNCLKIQHPGAATIISGDKNSLDIKHILALNPTFRQSVTKNTRNGKILTILISDLHSYYHVPLVIPPVPVDVAGQGILSDHCGVLAVPLTTEHSQRAAEVRTLNVRPLPGSLISKFGSILVNEDWSFLAPELSPTQLVEAFQNHTSQLIEDIFPEKKCENIQF